MAGATWLDGLQAVAAVATAVGVFLAWAQLKAQRTQTRTSFEDELTKQYRDVISTIPVGALLGRDLPGVLDEEVLGAFYRYFDLTNEQIFLKNKKRISDETWENWRDGIRTNMKRPAFNRAWSVVASAVPESFDELRALVPPTALPSVPAKADQQSSAPSSTRRHGVEVVMPDDAAGRVLAIRKASNASWANIRKAIAALSDIPHEPFGTPNVENTSKSIVKRMMRETGLSMPELSRLINGLAPPADSDTEGEGGTR